MVLPAYNQRGEFFPPRQEQLYSETNSLLHASPSTCTRVAELKPDTSPEGSHPITLLPVGQVFKPHSGR